MMAEMEPLIPAKMKLRRVGKQDGTNCPNVAYAVRVRGERPEGWPSRPPESWSPAVSLWETPDGWRVDIYNTFYTILKSQAGDEAVSRWRESYQEHATPPEEDKGLRERYREAEAERQDSRAASPEKPDR